MSDRYEKFIQMLSHRVLLEFWEYIFPKVNTG